MASDGEKSEGSLIKYIKDNKFIIAGVVGLSALTYYLVKSKKCCGCNAEANAAPTCCPEEEEEEIVESKANEANDDNQYSIPNALASFKSIIPNNNNLLLFLDYDGTLSEIVRDPDKAVLTESMSKVLDELASIDKVCVIITTGRSIEKVRSFVPENKNIHFAGNHGIEIELANDHKDQLFVDEESVKLLHSAWKELQDEYKVCEKYSGTQIEYKKYSMSLHYRRMKVENEEKAIQELSQIMSDLSTKYKIHLSEGKKVFELKCVKDWNKGYAIKWMLENRAKIFKLQNEESNVLFIGDDVTDEDGFDALLNYKSEEKVVDVVSSILVTHNKVRDTKATYYVNKVKDVEVLLNKIVATLKSKI